MNHNFNKSILRAYDIRGIFGKTLIAEDAYYVGRSYATYLDTLNKHKVVCVGYDGRLSSPELYRNLVDGLKDSGVDVKVVGLGPTPMLYFSVKKFQASGGIMVTGSHNPADHNGFKLMKDKLPLYGDEILALGEIAKKGKFIEGQGQVTEHDIKHDYVDYLAKFLQKTNKKQKIAWDPGNGAAGEIVELLTKKIPGQHILLNTKIDGSFPGHHPDPSVAENMQQLIEVVKEQLEKITWVKYAVVERNLPSTLNIKIVERVPVALWQDNGTLHLIDNDGEIIRENNLSRFANLIILVGDDVPLYAKSLFRMISSYPETQKLISSAIRVGQRRWNIRLYNGTEIKLPEENAEDAWHIISQLQKERNFLESKNKTIDLRIQKKMYTKDNS